MAQKLRGMQVRNFTEGVWRYIQNNLAPLSSYKFGLNLDSNKKLGSLTIRKGLEIIGEQLVASKSFFGIYNHIEQDDSNNKLFAVAGDGNIYDVVAGTVSLTGDTVQKTTRFVTYLGSTLRVNGTDALKAYTNGSWEIAQNATFTAAISDTITSTAHGLSNGDIIKLSTTDTLPDGLTINTPYYIINKTDDTFEVSISSGGTAVDILDTGTGTHTWEKWDTFDLSNIPNLELVIEWKDRLYGVDMSNPDTLLYSGIANPTTKTISWTSGNGSLIMEQEDNGGGIKALVKIPGYLLAFKRHTMKRWNGSGTYPDDMINQGVPSQEAVCVGRGMAMFLNESGIWATNGGYPQKISRPISDIVEAIDSSHLASVTSYCDDNYAQWSVGEVKIDGTTYSNVVLKFNLDDNSWNIRAYKEVFEFPTLYINNNKRVIVSGNDDGEVFQVDKGTTDNGAAISFQLDLQPNDFGVRGRTKTVTKISAFVSGTTNAQISTRLDSINPADYKTATKITDLITNVDTVSLRCNVLDIRIAGISKSGGVVIDGIEFDKSGVQINETKQ